MTSRRRTKRRTSDSLRPTPASRRSTSAHPARRADDGLATPVNAGASRTSPRMPTHGRHQPSSSIAKPRAQAVLGDDATARHCAMPRAQRRRRPASRPCSSLRRSRWRWRWPARSRCTGRDPLAAHWPHGGRCSRRCAAWPVPHRTAARASTPSRSTAAACRAAEGAGAATACRSCCATAPTSVLALPSVDLSSPTSSGSAGRAPRARAGGLRRRRRASHRGCETPLQAPAVDAGDRRISGYTVEIFYP